MPEALIPENQFVVTHINAIFESNFHFYTYYNRAIELLTALPESSPLYLHFSLTRDCLVQAQICFDTVFNSIFNQPNERPIQATVRELARLSEECRGIAEVVERLYHTSIV